MKKIWKTTSNFIIISLVILTVALFALRLSGFSMSGKAPVSFFEIVTGSMEPTLKSQVVENDKIVSRGDIVIVFKKKINKLKENDIISYYSDLNHDGNYEIITHRLKNIQDIDGITYYTVEGDAEGSLKEVFTSEGFNEVYVGKVLFNHKAYITSFLYKIITNIYGFLLLVVAPLLFLLIKEVMNLAKISTKDEAEFIRDDGKVETVDKKSLEEEIKKDIKKS